MMTTVVATADLVVLNYTGGPLNVPPQCGPCNLLYSVSQTGRLKNVIFLSENNGGQIGMLFAVTDIVDEATWLTMGPQGESDPLRLEPIKIIDINTLTEVITLNGQTCSQILGALNNIGILYTTTTQGGVERLDRIAFTDTLNQGAITLKFIIDDKMPLDDWLQLCILGVKVDSLQF
jgi:hypothetical protein